MRTILTAAIAVLLLMGRAFAATPGGVGGTVTDSDGRPIAGASVSLQGPGNSRAVTDARGSFSLGGVSPGEYTLVISKSGFAQYTQLLSVFAGETAQVHAALIASTFASLRTIAHVSTTHAGYAAINTTTAAVNTINGQVFANQGQLQVTKVLNETPGVIAQGAPGNNNGASQGSPQTVQIRGTLPYETESLIDGHPTPISLTGTFNPIYLNPALLEDVEVVKGPGYMGPEINYAIGGTANYITLQPTRTPQALLTVGTDNWGGV
ncbi:MAG: TonB-dependent receptor, partial [Candidatus Eremiobacteraeota bacterium]|nr:TonB-dependent receptor [Candidatus Eremiobacteraeota bacterium]